MAASLCSSFSSLRLQPAQLSSSGAMRGQQLVAVRPQRSLAAAAFVVEAKQNSLKRQRTAETARMYNKARKSEVATRMKKVLTALDAFKAAPPAAEADLAPVQALINEAYQVIDKAVSKGVLHINTAARRKARLAKARQNVLVAAGLYTPAQ
ncbi:30S ribosomal chloroplastic [Chlorella sorokiniana]|uniref:30S ribosomal chloroplastic n=1 Tax=Chlorella sorokiniana TaxID=3076 RepID=A0A2P6TQS0_CHLSO|nr:30S ribosomal chloroplastic [Chlorella sorokiniana]|eukprot:PRW56415.1 30S ribosomal chloroplastic [Chlorella sorokiniana]